MTTSGVPSAGSKQQMIAWCVGRSVLWGNRLTSLVVSAPAEGRNAGIAANKALRSGTVAATRGGTDARPPLTSTMAAATASTRRSRSSRDSTSVRDKISMAPLRRLDEPAREDRHIGLLVPDLAVEAERVGIAVADHQL